MRETAGTRRGGQKGFKEADIPEDSEILTSHGGSSWVFLTSPSAPWLLALLWGLLPVGPAWKTSTLSRRHLQHLSWLFQM